MPFFINMRNFAFRELAPSLPLEVDPHSYDSPHTKANLLFQAHFTRHPLPSTDYLTDTNSVLDQAIRILQVCPEKPRVPFC